MIKKKIFTRKRVIALLFIKVMAVVIIGVVSYMALRRLTFGGAGSSYDEMRQKNNERAVVVQKKLATQYGARPVMLKSEDGIALTGLYIERPNAKYNVVLCHGYRNNKESLDRFLPMFEDANIIMFDFRGHGQSGGDFITIGYNEYKDVVAASKGLRQLASNPNLPLILVGVSMGGAAAIKAAALDPTVCEALIIDSAYADLWEVISNAFSQHSGLPVFPFLMVMEYMLGYMSNSRLREMRPETYVKSIKHPIFFIHSSYDAHTAPNDTLRLYNEVGSEHAKLWIGPKTVHGLLSKTHFDTYKRKVNTFIRRSLFGLPY